MDRHRIRRYVRKKSWRNPAKGIPEVRFHFDLSTPVVKGDLIPDHLRLLALEILDGIPSDAIKIYTNSNRLSDRAGSGIYIEKRGERSFCHHNPDFSSIFKSKLIALEHGLEAVLNEQDFGDLWILSDSHSSLQHLCNWITVGDKAGISILQKLTQISESHDVHFQWIPSHVNIFGNEQVDLLAKEVCNASPPISSTLTLSKHQSRVQSEILKKWRNPPNHNWYESKHPGSSFLLKCGRASQIAISRQKSGHIKSLLWRQEDFCSLHQVQDSASLSKSHLGQLGTFEGGPFFLSPSGIELLKGQWSFGSCLNPSDRLRISHNNNQ
ncbi:RNase H domain-containing protein [Trichonephila clavipes]|nr:RNase H domain-containing protein [Trichonephila clavipes]